MRAQGGQLQVNRAADVVIVRRLKRQVQIQFANFMRFITLGQQFRENRTSFGAGKGGVQSRFTGGAVVGMVDVLVADKIGGWVLADDAVGFGFADDAGEVAPQFHRGLQRAVGIIEKTDVAHVNFGGRGQLLGAAEVNDLPAA